VKTGENQQKPENESTKAKEKQAIREKSKRNKQLEKSYREGI